MTTTAISTRPMIAVITHAEQDADHDEADDDADADLGDVAGLDRLDVEPMLRDDSLDG